jgi:hypothetical protein
MNNVGTIDRWVRLLVGLSLIALVYTGPKTLWGWIGLIPSATAVMAYCPMYTVLGINCPDKHQQSEDRF